MRWIPDRSEKVRKSGMFPLLLSIWEESHEKGHRRASIIAFLVAKSKLYFGNRPRKSRENQQVRKR
jgi:hypothetical protein